VQRLSLEISLVIAADLIDGDQSKISPILVSACYNFKSQIPTGSEFVLHETLNARKKKKKTNEGLRLNEFYYGKANKLQAFNSTQA
jgi:hypothetical protein